MAAGGGPLSTLVHIVDDDASFRVSAGRLLRACGYKVSLYGSADQLLEHLPEDDGASCILLDVNIPGLSGPQLQERLSMLGSSMPIVFLTGSAKNLTSLQPTKSGVEDFLTK